MEWEQEVLRVEPEFNPWAPWQARVGDSKIALVSTAGVYLKKGLHQPFSEDDPSFREFPSVVAGDDLELSDHVRFDPRHAREDLNVVFPLERLHELATGGYIGAVAPFAYSLGAQRHTWVPLLANFAPSLAYRMKRMNPDLVLVVATDAVSHQSAALIARAIEVAGVPTVVLGSHRGVLERVLVPRAVVVRHPDGAPLGNPGNAGKHQFLLREVLDRAWELEGPGLIIDLPHVWTGR